MYICHHTRFEQSQWAGIYFMQCVLLFQEAQGSCGAGQFQTQYDSSTRDSLVAAEIFCTQNPGICDIPAVYHDFATRFPSYGAVSKCPVLCLICLQLSYHMGYNFTGDKPRNT